MIPAASFQTFPNHLFSPKPASTGHTLLSSLTPSAGFPFRVPEHAKCSFPSWNLCSGFAVSSQPPASQAGPSPLSRLSLARNSEGPLLTALPTKVSISIFMHLRPFFASSVAQVMYVCNALVSPSVCLRLPTRPRATSGQGPSPSHSPSSPGTNSMLVEYTCQALC